MLDIRFDLAPVQDENLAFYRKHLPRILALSAFAIVVVSLYRTIGWDVSQVYLAILGLAFWIFLIKRRSIGRAIAKNNPNHIAYAAEISKRQAGPAHHSLLHAIGELRGMIAAATFLIGIILFGWGLIDPLSLGQNFNTLYLLTIWGATLLPIGSIITYYGNRSGVPVVLVLVAVVLIFSFFNDNHQIRRLEKDSTEFTDTRPSFQDTLEKWSDENCEKSNNQENRECERFIVVAAAGGGIRAGYWTGTVLSKLHDLALPKKQFNNNLFAISGVSGDSVGATIYRAATTAYKDNPVAVTGSVKSILTKDYLGPISAGLLYPDFIQTIWPFSHFQDRANVFERGLEQGY